MSILVTGGAGFIGSHTAVELLNSGYDIVIADNFSNSSPVVLDRIKQITGKDFKFYLTELTDIAQVEKIFDECDIEAVIHFAGLKAVGESISNPLLYYNNNLISTLALLDVMFSHGCKTLVFSSSATVYGVPDSVPVNETAPLRTTNPYGATKLMIENMLRDVCKADPEKRVVLLRYFNPIGAHESGLIGEDPIIPNNLMPYIVRVAAGLLPHLNVFGNDYPTKDGTCIRDFIHVVDLARGHLAALDYLKTHKGNVAVNLGTGNGYSVLELVDTYEKVSGLSVKKVFAPRRDGDAAESYADPTKAYELFGWKAEYGIDRMCEDTYRWQKTCPHGYKDN